MQYHQIKAFSGVSTRVESTDQDRGTVRRAEGVAIAPNGALSSPLSWLTLWGITSVGNTVADAMADKTDGYGYFLTLARDGNTVLLFYEKGAGVRGLWWVRQNTASPVSAASGGVAVAEAGGGGIDLTGVAKTYYGCWINDDLWLGHGTRKNFIWHSDTGQVAELGSTAPASLYDIGQEQFPPCRAFVQSPSGVVWGAGNTATADYALRVWMTDVPNSKFPTPERVRNLETSFVDLAHADATEIKSLSIWQSYVIVHTDRRPWIVRNAGQSDDGYFAQQNATPLSVSAPNPNCSRDLTGIGEFWFGEDREIYKDDAIRASSPDKDFARERDIRTSLADNIWNERMSLDPSGAHTVFDRVNGRFYVFAPLKAGSDPYAPAFNLFGCYVWSDTAKGLSGPILFPNAHASTTGRETTNRLNRVIVATVEGGLLFADLDELREREEFELEDYDAADDGTFGNETLNELQSEDGGILLTESGDELLSEGTFGGNTSYVWLQGTVDRNLDGELYQFPESGRNGRFRRFAKTVFLDAAPEAVTQPEEAETLQWRDAVVGRIEFAAEDFGSVNVEKMFQEVRVNWQRDSRCYVGIFVRTDYGQADGYWIGNPWPGEEQVIGINVRGRRLQVTIMVVFSNHPGSRAMLRDATIGYLPSITAQG